MAVLEKSPMLDALEHRAGTITDPHTRAGVRAAQRFLEEVLEYRPGRESRLPFVYFADQSIDTNPEAGHYNQHRAFCDILGIPLFGETRRPALPTSLHDSLEVSGELLPAPRPEVANIKELHKLSVPGFVGTLVNRTVFMQQDVMVSPTERATLFPRELVGTPSGYSYNLMPVTP